jgi:hypothetical protein
LKATIRSSFLDKYLDPVSSLGEILFGIIMTLTFTLAAGIMVREEGREGARQLLIATIGCNVAWGIIDAALYVLGQLFERGRRRRLVRTLQEASDLQAAIPVVAAELDELLATVTTDAERRALYERIAKRLRSAADIPWNRVTRADLLGAFASFWLVLFASLPAALPFLLVDEPFVALRISNALLLAMLFAVGWLWSRHTVAKPVLTGLVLLAGGVVLVTIAIALGG